MDGTSKLNAYKDREAARVRTYAKNAGMKTPEKYADGGAVRKSGGTTVNIMVGKPQGGDGMQAAALASALAPKPPPVTMSPPAPPPPAGGPPAPPMGAPGIGGMPMPGMKRGGRATALPMTAGAMSGPGREEKAASQAKAEGKRKKS